VAVVASECLADRGAAVKREDVLCCAGGRNRSKLVRFLRASWETEGV
jgi:hypothetical protein